MPTVAELKAIIKAHQNKNCQKFSGMKKAELLKMVSRIQRIRKQRERGVACRNKSKTSQKDSLKLNEGKKKLISEVKKLSAERKKFSSSLTLKKPVKKKACRKPTAAKKAKAAAKKKEEKKYKMTEAQKSEFRQVMSQVKDPNFSPRSLPPFEDPRHKRDMPKGIIRTRQLWAPSVMFSELYREPGDFKLNDKQKLLYADRMYEFRSYFPKMAKAIKRGMSKLDKPNKKKYRFLLATLPIRQLDDLILKYS